MLKAMELKYSIPECSDTAVCMCFFSPAGFQKPKQNFLHVEKLLRDAKIPTFTAECVIGNQAPLLKNPTISVKSDSCLFYKEQLYNLLVPKVPEQYTKLVFIDADIMFNKRNWIDQISKALDIYDVVQPFESAVFMSPMFGMNIKILKSFGFGIAKGMRLEDSHTYHHGFSFAMTRSYYNKIGGFFDKCIIGSGDTCFACLFFKDKTYYALSNFILEEYKTWLDKAYDVPKKFTYLPMTVYHMYHGSYSDRRYRNRQELLNTVKSWDEFAYTNEYRVYELKDKEHNKIMKEYFLSRKEDDFPEFKFGIHK